MSATVDVQLGGPANVIWTLPSMPKRSFSRLQQNILRLAKRGILCRVVCCVLPAVSETLDFGALKRIALAAKDDRTVRVKVEACKSYREVNPDLA